MKQLWTWNWTSGGYHACRADTYEEALDIARQMGQPKDHRTVTLTPDEKTLRAVTEQEMDRIDRMWAAMLN